MDSIAAVCRQRRILRGMTQDHAAKAAGISRSTLSDFEAGGDRISLSNLNRLLRALGLMLTTREATSRPTLDELSERYQSEEATPLRQRVRRSQSA